MFEQINIKELGGKNIYFASDFHLGSPTQDISFKRELKIIKWLDSIKEDCHTLFLVGDIFDFWYEYKRAIPKGFVRFQAKITELTDAGIPVYFFTGNHDMWMFGYLEKELGVKIIREEIELNTKNHSFLVGHGDGLGPRDYAYKFFRTFFRNRFCQWLFGRFHPNLGIGIATNWSNKSRKKGNKQPEVYQGNDEWILQHCKEQELIKHHDFYIYGHRHLVIDTLISETARYVNLGEWYSSCNYGIYDGNHFALTKFE